MSPSRTANPRPRASGRLPSDAPRARSLAWRSLPELVRVATLAVLAGAAAVALGVLLSGCSMPREARFEEQSHLVVAFAPQTQIVIDNARGSVRLVPGDSLQVRVDARKRTVAPMERQAEALAREVQVELVREGPEFRIVVHYPRRMTRSSVRVEMFGRDVRHRRADVDLTVAVPPNRPVTVITRNGDLTAEATSGPLEFRTSSGDLEVTLHRGSLKVFSSSGDARVQRLDGDLSMSSTSGDLNAELVGGSLNFRSTSGDLSAQRVASTLEATTVSGDVEVQAVGGASRVSSSSGDVVMGQSVSPFEVSTASGDVQASLESMGNISVESASGDVELTLPGKPKGRLEITTASGEVSARVPMTLERATRRQLEGILGPGDGLVAVHTSSGDVRVAVASQR